MRIRRRQKPMEKEKKNSGKQHLRRQHQWQQRKKDKNKRKFKDLEAVLLQWQKRGKETLSDKAKQTHTWHFRRMTDSYSYTVGVPVWKKMTKFRRPKPIRSFNLFVKNRVFFVQKNLVANIQLPLTRIFMQLVK